MAIAKQTFNNDTSLMSAVINDLLIVVNNTGKGLAEEVKFNVEEIIYSSPEGKLYERLGEIGGFLGSWISTEAKKERFNAITTRVYSEPSLMELGGDQNSHGDESLDRRPFMSQYIIEGTDFDFGGNAAIGRDFWTPLVGDISAGVFDYIIERELTRRGIKFIKVSSGIAPTAETSAYLNRMADIIEQFIGMILL